MTLLLKLTDDTYIGCVSLTPRARQNYLELFLKMVYLPPTPRSEENVPESLLKPVGSSQFFHVMIAENVTE